MDINEYLEQEGIKPGTNEEEPEKYDLTREEEELLCSIYVDEERIQDGFLYSFQVKTLEALRYCHRYLDEKYPEDEFRFCIIRPVNRFNKTGEIEFYSEKLKGQYYMLTYTENEDKYSAMDNYYAVFVREPYDDMLQKLLWDNLGIKGLCYTDFYQPMGIETGRTTSAEELIAKRSELSRQTTVYMDRKTMEDHTLDEIRKLFSEKGLYGGYDLCYGTGLLSGQSDVNGLRREIESNGTEVLDFECFNCFDVV